MAIYHLSVTQVQRSKGHSAVAGAAYRSGSVLYDRMIDQTHDYQRKRGIVQSAILAPDQAPEWVYDREELWNRAELAEKRRDAQPAREVRVALPAELSDEQRADLVFRYVQEVFVGAGMVADLSIHRPDRHGDQRNHHAHILLTMRELDGDDFAVRKNRDWNKPALLETWREQWEEYQNRALEEAGSDARVDHRSLEAQGSLHKPTRHLGKDATAMEREGIATRIGDENREVEAYNRRMDQLVSELAQVEAEIAQELDRQYLPAQEPEEVPAFSLEATIDAEGTLTWEEEKAQLQHPANVDVTNLFEKQIAEYAPESQTAFLADREPDPDGQPPSGEEEKQFRAHDPLESALVKEFERQIKTYGAIQEYGLGKTWLERTVAMFEDFYYDAAQTAKETWEKYVKGRFRDRDNDPDREIGPER